jgi:DNA polymerase-3 subunit alpha
VSHSHYQFTVKDDTVYFSLGAIKGVGEGAVQAIIEAREKLPEKRFSSLEEFFEAVDFKRVNKKVIECLIKAGALDEFGYHRAQLSNGYEKFLDAAESTKKDKAAGQGNLFAMMDSTEQSQEAVRLEDCPPWTRSARLAYEKEVLGFYLSDHPLAGFGDLVKVWTTCSVDSLKDQEAKKRVFLAGLIVGLKEFITKKGTRMSFAQLEDLTGSVELVVFPDTFAKCETQLKADLPVLVGGTLERDGDSHKILVDRVGLLEDAPKKSKQMVLQLDASMQSHLHNLSHLLKKFPGSTGLALEIDIPDMRKTVTLEVLDPQGVSPSSEFFEDLHGLFGRTDFVEIRG